MSHAEPIEQVLALHCAGARAWGILTHPPAGTPVMPVLVLIAVGGPQYRVGSHRQFVQLARAMARRGYRSLRFDYLGMGDSEGELRNFEQVAEDFGMGADALWQACPGANGIVVWGLCDAASAAMMFATADARVIGLAAVNPWARSATSLSAVHVRHYYLARVLQRDFWAKLVRGRLNWRRSIGTLLDNLRQMRRRDGPASNPNDGGPFQHRMARGLAGFRGRLLLIVSGNDLTAKEFFQYTASAPEWRVLLARANVSRCDIAEADHTLSRRSWSERAEAATIDWLQSFADAPSNA